MGYYIYGPAGRFAKRTTISGESYTFYYHTDYLGSTRLVTDSDRNVVSAIAYHTFGEPSLKEGSDDSLFTGEEKNETGLYYYGTRRYDPDLGRFLARDPYSNKLVKPQSLNQYTYYYNNPLLFVDPDGRDPHFVDGTKSFCLLKEVFNISLSPTFILFSSLSNQNNPVFVCERIKIKTPKEFNLGFWRIAIWTVYTETFIMNQYKKVHLRRNYVD